MLAPVVRPACPGAAPRSRHTKLLAAALALTASCSDPVGPSFSVALQHLAPPVRRAVRAEERAVVVEDTWVLLNTCWKLGTGGAQLAGNTLTITIREELDQRVVACLEVLTPRAFRVTVADLPPDPTVLRVVVLKDVYGDGGRWRGIFRVFETGVVRP